MKKFFAILITLVMLVSLVPLTVITSSAGTFTDVPENAYYSDAVEWAYASGITTGVSATRFAPDSTTTRGQVVTFLWRALGEPEPETTENPFEDVKTSDYFYKAVLWAVEEGITNGTSAKRFSPSVTCTNAHILTFIWRAMGEPEKTGNGEWYEDAVNWAESAGMLDGTFEGTFNPNGQCPRANVVTYLYKYDKTGSSILRVFVSASGNDATADGTASKPFATITAVRDYLRTVSKDSYNQIIVRIGAGEYQITEPITLTAEDGGSESCEVKYIGEDGATIIGGVSLNKADFKKTSGGLTKYFGEDVRDNILMIDLKDYGFTPELIKKAMENFGYLNEIPFLSVDGKRQIVAQYPNDWLHVGKTVTHSADGTTNTAIDHVTLQTVEYGEEHAEAVQSWSQVLPVFVRARLFKLWCPDDTKVAKIYKDEDKIDIYFGGGHEPEEGTILYFYNVPEALDIPGEYIIDTDAILYYYPTEEFADGIVTLPISEGLIVSDNTDYLTIKNLTFTSANGNGLVLSGKHITLEDCTISSIKSVAAIINSEGCTVRNNIIFDIGSKAVTVTSGDAKNAVGDPCIITENDISNYSVSDAYGNAITASGTNITISHNDCHDANTCGIYVPNSVNVVIEYNELWNLSRLCDDMGMISCGGRENSNVVVRYNYIHDILPAGEAGKILEVNPDFGYYGTYAIYYDNGSSYIETYGNVVKTVDNGYLSNGGRGNVTHGNLFIDCRMWYVIYSHFMYSASLRSDGTLMSSSMDSFYTTSKLWKELQPDLSEIIWDTDGVDPNNPNIWCVPAKNVCYSNWIVYNKSERIFTNWGIRPYNIEDKVEQFSGDDIDINDQYMSLYSSKRTEIDLKEIIETTAADVIEITWEQFQMIGRTAN